MKIHLLYQLLFCSFFLLVLSCKNEPSKTNVNRTTVAFDSLKLKCYADTIICDMVVKSPDKEDKWMEECLGRLKRNELISSIFEDIYNSKLIAYDFATHKELTINEVKKIETTPGYNKNIISKFQFREAWFYDKQHHTFIKKVYSIIFGYEVYDDNKNVRGYKPLFKVEF